MIILKILYYYYYICYGDLWLVIFYVTTAVPCRFIWWLAFFINKVFLKYVHFKRHNAVAYLTDLQYSVETTFIRTGKQKKIMWLMIFALLWWSGTELNNYLQGMPIFIHFLNFSLILSFSPMTPKWPQNKF